METPKKHAATIAEYTPNCAACADCTFNLAEKWVASESTFGTPSILA